MGIMKLRTHPWGSSQTRSARRVVEAVDHALWALPPRSCLTHHEAALAVAEVLVAVADAPAVRTVSNTLDGVVTATDSGAFVNRMVLADALLDLRLAMGH